MKKRLLLLTACLLAFAEVAHGYFVSSALTLEKLEGEADLIFKGTAVSTEPCKDEWFKSYPGFTGWETKFKIISVIRGDAHDTAVGFRHYDRNPADVQEFSGMNPDPQSYHFEQGQTYIVFAKKNGVSATFRQLWLAENALPDQGVLRCADSALTTAKTVQEIFWNELMHLLNDEREKNVLYAIKHLDAMSQHRHSYPAGTEDFDRKKVLASVHALMARREPEIARAAIDVIASGNPYHTDERAEYWLATVGSADVPGIGKMDPKMKNPGGETYWKELVAIADGKAEASTRALAVRALGLAREPKLKEAIPRWIADEAPEVRAAAALLLADFPGAETDRRLTTLADDPSVEVRVCVAHSAGFMQRQELVGLLGKLLKDDQSDKVRRAASVSLLSFSPKHEAVAAVFRANIKNEEFSPLFLNALAVENPQSHLDGLARAVVKKQDPRNWSGGQIPAFTAWNILFKYLQSRPHDEVRAGKLDRYLDAMEHGYETGSSEPRDIYAFYFQRGMRERAKKYRQAANKAAHSDLDYFFKQVDQNPGNYTR